MLPYTPTSFDNISRTSFYVHSFALLQRINQAYTCSTNRYISVLQILRIANLAISYIHVYEKEKDLYSMQKVIRFWKIFNIGKSQIFKLYNPAFTISSHLSSLILIPSFYTLDRVLSVQVPGYILNSFNAVRR